MNNLVGISKEYCQKELTFCSYRDKEKYDYLPYCNECFPHNHHPLFQREPPLKEHNMSNDYLMKLTDEMV